MSEQSFWIPHVMPGMNEIIAAAKQRNGKWSGYAALKKKWGGIVAVYARNAKLVPMDYVSVAYHIVEPNRRRDRSNVAFGITKIVEDTLVTLGILPGDGPKYIAGIAYTFALDKDAPGVRVTLTEVERIAPTHRKKKLA